MTVDLHGQHPAELECRFGNAGKLADYIREAWEAGQHSITFIHGHGRNRGISPGFVNTNTGYLGLCVRAAIRRDKSIRQWIFHTTIDCSDMGTTTVRLKPKAMRVERNAQ